MQQSHIRRAVWIAIFAVLGVLAVVSAYQGAKNAMKYSQDFQWDAARALYLGLDPYELSLRDAEEERNRINQPEYGGDSEATPETGDIGEASSNADVIPESASEAARAELIKDPLLSAYYKSFEDMGAPQKMEANQFPSLLGMLIPFALLPWGIAKPLWLILNFLFTIGIAVLLRRTFLQKLPLPYFAGIMLFMAAGTPWRNQIGVGQHTLFSVFFFLLSYYLCERADELIRIDRGLDLGTAGKETVIPKAADEYDKPGQSIKAGRQHSLRIRIFTVLSVLALTISYFKYTVTAPLAIIFLYRKKWGIFFSSAAVHIIATFFWAAKLGKSFFYMILEPLKVSSALSGEGSIDIGAIAGGGLSAAFAAAAILFLIIIALVLSKSCQEEDIGLCRRAVHGQAGAKKPAPARFISETVFFTMALLISLIMIYHRTYDYFLLAVAAGGVYELYLHGKKALSYIYAIVVLYFFFGLRFFSESTPSLIAAGILYYGFLLLFILQSFQKERPGTA